MTLSISGLAACTPVGLHAASTCAALRAGVSNTMELYTHAVIGEMIDREPMIGGRVPTEWFHGGPVEERWPGHERFGMRPPPPKDAMVPPGIERIVELCRHALEEIRESAALEGLDPQRYRVYVALSELDPTLEIEELLRGTLGGSADRFVVRPQGRAGALALLDEARRDVAERRCAGALVGGVDSMIRTPVAQHFDDLERLKSDVAPQGLTPGEGAGFVFIESPQAAAERGRTCFANVDATALGAETSHDKADEPNQGKGLTAAMRGAREAAGLNEMPFVTCDLNGERPRALEWTMAATRVLGDLHGDCALWHPAENTGDMGAAAGAVDLVWTAMALHRGYAPAQHALVWGASESPLRAAAVLSRSE